MDCLFLISAKRILVLLRTLLSYNFNMKQTFLKHRKQLEHLLNQNPYWIIYICLCMEFLFTEVNILHCAVSSLAIERKSKSRKLSSTPGKKASKVRFRYQVKNYKLFFLTLSSCWQLRSKQKKISKVRCRYNVKTYLKKYKSSQ